MFVQNGLGNFSIELRLIYKYLKNVELQLTCCETFYVNENFTGFNLNMQCNKCLLTKYKEKHVV